MPSIAPGGYSSPLRYSSPVRSNGGSGSKDRKPERAVSIPPLRSVPLPLVAGMAGMEIVGVGRSIDPNPVVP